jgi:transposase-like protein
MKGCKNVRALAKELEVDLRGLYRWRQRLDPEAGEPRREAGRDKEVERLKRALAEKVLEVDFLRGALHKVEARRRQSESGGERASTTRSEK